MQYSTKQTERLEYSAYDPSAAFIVIMSRIWCFADIFEKYVARGWALHT